MKPSAIKADIELKELLTNKVFAVDSEGNSTPVTVYTDGDRSGVDTPDDFIDIFFAGDISSLDVPMSFIKGAITVSLYVRLNPDNTIKKNRVEKILSQFDELISKHSTEHYYYDYPSMNFITPTTAYTTIGYSMTLLTLMWHTK